MANRMLYAVAVRADFTTTEQGITTVIEQITQSGVLVAETDEEALRLAYMAAERRYPYTHHKDLRVHVSRVPEDKLRELVAGLATPIVNMPPTLVDITKGKRNK
jgi:hypothetical protein